jgi:hypothetical protein
LRAVAMTEKQGVHSLSERGRKAHVNSGPEEGPFDAIGHAPCAKIDWVVTVWACVCTRTCCARSVELPQNSRK